MDLSEFLLARIAEDERNASLEIGRRDVVLVGAFAPARVLAECDAKRRIVEMGGHLRNGGLVEGRILLGYLALPYADHEQFQEEWRP